MWNIFTWMYNTQTKKCIQVIMPFESLSVLAWKVSHMPGYRSKSKTGPCDDTSASEKMLQHNALIFMLLAAAMWKSNEKIF